MSKISTYYNSKAILYIVFLLIGYVLIDGFGLDFENDKNAVSKSFYSKLILSILLFVAGQEKRVIGQVKKPIDAAFHFSIFSLCVWFGLSSLLLEELKLSKIIGIFVFFGGLTAFSLIDELLEVLHVRGALTISLNVLEISLKILLFSIFLLSMFLLFSGEWVWEIRPFYQW